MAAGREEAEMPYVIGYLHIVSWFDEWIDDEAANDPDFDPMLFLEGAYETGETGIPDGHWIVDVEIVREDKE